MIAASIVIPSYRRPQLLARTIASCLAQQDVDLPFEIVVVDNDPEGSARPIVDAAVAHATIPIRYVAEPRPGISQSRNSGVAAAAGQYVIFIDDDEEASPGWLAAFFATVRRYDADVAVGPVQPRFVNDADVDPFAVQTYTRNARVPTGTQVHWGGIGNAIINRERWLVEVEPFDPRFGLTGGEDTLFLRRLERAGGRILWCAEAAVRETISEDKTTPGYLLRRAIRGGQGTTFLHLAARPAEWGAAAKWIAIGVAQMAVYGPIGLALRATGQPNWLRTLAKAASGLGKVVWPASLHVRLYSREQAATRAHTVAPRKTAESFAEIVREAQGAEPADAARLPRPAAASPVEVSIVIPSYRRPESLARTIESCLSQRGVDIAYEIIVVDNDNAQSARSVTEAAAAKASVPVRYMVEPDPGVSQARNAGVAAAAGRRVLFIDDDEEATPGWLAAFLAAADRFRADVLVGPVQPVFPVSIDKVDPLAVRLYTRNAGVPTGTPVQWGHIGNAMIDKERCLQEVEPFDPKLGFTGGEDSLFLRRLERRGRNVVWCADALVRETIPADRLASRYLLLRAFRGGQSTTFVHIAVQPKEWSAVARWMVIGAAQVLLYGCWGLLLWFVRRPSLQALSKAASGLGKVLWPRSVQIELYRLGR